MRKKLLVKIFFLIVQNFCAQGIIQFGNPHFQPIKSEKSRDYFHIWNLDEAPNHIIYFVDEYGLQEYDGAVWNSYKGSVGITRSLKVVDNNTIFTGSDNDFGVWKKDEFQKFRYKSLFPNRNKKNVEVEEFWNVFKLKDAIVFKSFQNLYIYKKGKFTVLRAASKFLSACQNGNLLYLSDEKGSLHSFDGYQLQKVTAWNLPETNVIAIEDYGEDKLVITDKKGIYRIKNGRQAIPLKLSQDPILQTDIVTSFKKIGKDYFAIGTIRNGLLISDLEGRILHKINKQNGLQNNSVLSLHYSSYGQLIVGQYFGLDFLSISSNISYVMDYSGKLGTTYAAVSDGNRLLLGSNQGLYSTYFESLKDFPLQEKFSVFDNSYGQVWTLENFNGEIFCGHNNGLYKVVANKLIPIDTKPGVWSIVKFGKYLLTGNYEGVHVYEKRNGKWQFYKSLAGIYGSCNQLLTIENTLFVQIPWEGVLELKLDPELRIEKTILHPASLFGNQLFRLKNRGIQLIVSTLDYDYTKPYNRVVPFKKIKKSTNSTLKSQLLPEFFDAKKLNSRLSLYSIYNGFALLDRDIESFKSIGQLPFPLIRNSTYFTDALEVPFSAYASLKPSQNNLRFSFVVPNYPETVEYQYFLKGYSENWSSFSTKRTVEFVNLHPGKYLFSVRARSGNVLSPISALEFKISTPFYKSLVAKILLFVLFLGLMYMFKKYLELRLRKQRWIMLKNQQKNMQEQAQKYREELYIRNEEKLQKEQENLKKTLETKELELAQKIIKQQEVNELIQSIKRKFQEVQEASSEKLNYRYYKEVISFIDKKIDKEIFKEFEIAFDNSQLQFHELLVKSHPQLSSKDLRMASFLIMNLSSKEIAQITNVLPSSVDVNRSRLRKKLELDEKTNLREYLLQFRI